MVTFHFSFFFLALLQFLYGLIFPASFAVIIATGAYSLLSLPSRNHSCYYPLLPCPVTDCPHPVLLQSVAVTIPNTYHRITEWVSLEGTTMGRLAQPLCKHWTLAWCFLKTSFFPFSLPKYTKQGPSSLRSCITLCLFFRGFLLGVFLKFFFFAKIGQF